MDNMLRPVSASTVATDWSQNTTKSVGHNVSNRKIPVIKGDVNFVNTTSTTDTDSGESVASDYVQEVLDQLSQSPIDSFDHEDALEFLYGLYYIHSPLNEDDSRIGRLLIDSDYCSTVHQCLIEFMKCGIYSDQSIRRSTQYIVYTLWNFSGSSIEFRTYLSTKQYFIQFLIINFLDYLRNLKGEQTFITVTENLIQAVISIIHNLTIKVNVLSSEQVFPIIHELLMEEKAMKSNERFRITLLLCLINLNPHQVYSNYNSYQTTFKSVFHFLKKLVQQEILMFQTGLSAWLLTYAVNKLPIDIVLMDDNRFYSFMVLFKRGVREEKLQAGLVLKRCIQSSTHAKQLIEKDATCWSLFQQFENLLHQEENV